MKKNCENKIIEYLICNKLEFSLIIIEIRD